MNRAPCMGGDGMFDYRPSAFKSKREAVRFDYVHNGICGERWPAVLPTRNDRTSFSEGPLERVVGQGRRVQPATH